MSISKQGRREYISGLLRTLPADELSSTGELLTRLENTEPWMWQQRERLATTILRKVFLTETVLGWDTARWLLQQIQNGELVRGLLLLRLFRDVFDESTEQVLSPERERVIVLEP